MGFKLLLFFEKLLMALPSSWRKAFFASLASIGYYASSRYRKVSYQNLDFLFQDTLSDEEKKRSPSMLLKIWHLIFFTLWNLEI